MSRLDEIQERLAHESERCCDHRNTEWGNCTDCMNTGHAHAPYVEGEAKRDMAALVKFARAMEGLHKPHKVICLNPSHSSDCDAMVCDACDTPWPCPTAKALDLLGGAS